jgi:hypothetical protein
MILYLDETKDSREAVAIVKKVYGDVPCAPASGGHLPEFVVGGKSYIGLRDIKEQCERAIGAHANHKTKEWSPHIDSDKFEVRFCTIPGCWCLASCCSEVRKVEKNAN